MLIINAEQLADKVKEAQVVTGRPTMPVVLVEQGQQVVRHIGYDGYMFRIGTRVVDPSEIERLEIHEVH